MKKVLLWICVLGTLSAQAEIPCVDGTIIVANNGTHFCKSNITLNWWSAEAWCHSQGENIHLAKFEDMCPGVTKKSGAICSNLESPRTLEGEYTSGNLLTDLAIKDSYALIISSGRLGGTWGRIQTSCLRNGSCYAYAVCQLMSTSQ